MSKGAGGSATARAEQPSDSLLKCYFPQVLGWFPTSVLDGLRLPAALAFSGSAQRAGGNAFKFFRRHNSVRQATLERRINSIKEARPLTTDGAVLSSSILMIKALCAQMKATLSAIEEFDREIEALCTVHQDYQLFQSLPGAGAIYASRLTAALGSDRRRWQSADELACLVGVAPVLEGGAELL